MQNAAQPMAEAYQQEHKKHHSWQKVVTVLSSIVVFCTTYALILPAITWDRTLICEKPEHVHTDECYEIVETEEEPILICEDPDHEHDRTCYYVPEKTVTKTLVCEIEEHEHTDACFDAPPAEDEGYYCGYIAHTHNELCYSPSGKLRCTIPEHVHELLCESNTEDVETEEIWTGAFAGSLSDDVLENMATIAESQIGYTEKENNFILEEDGETKIGYTRYGDWNGAPYEPWETDFAGFCLAYSKAKETPFDNDITNWMALLEKEGLLLNTEENGEPDSGYVVFYERAGRSRTETTLHVGVVDYRMEDGTLVIIGGDEDGSVEIFMIDEATVRSYLIPRKQTRRLLAAPAAAPLGAAPVGTVEKPENGYWVLASKIDDTAVDYLITSGDYALTYNATNSRGEIDKTAASGYTNYYTIDGVTDNMKVRFGANVDGNTVSTTVKVGSSNLRLGSGSIFGNSRSINVVDGGNTFQIYYNNNGTNYYLIYQNNAFSRNNNNNTSNYRNMTLYKNVPAQTVTFDPGGGSGTAEEFFLPKGQKPAASETIPTFTRDGYTFLGWSSDGGTTVLTEAQIRDLAVNSDVTYTAQWEKIPDPTTDGYWVRVDKVDATDADYLIVYSDTDYALTNGATGNQTVLKKTAVPGFSDTYLISNVTDQMKVHFGATVDGGTTQTSVRVGNTYVRLDNGTALGNTRNINVVDNGDTFRFYRSGYNYYLRHLDSGFTSDTGTGNRDMILYKNVPGHTVKFEPGEASGEEKSIAVPEGKTLANAEIPTYTFDGKFLGWSSDGGTTILTTEEVKALPITEDVTFVAMWKDNKVSVHFDLGEQSENVDPIDDLLVRAGDSIAGDDLPVPVWNSSDPLPFEGWYLDSNFETPYNGQTIDEETTLYAKFGSADEAYYVYYYDYERPGVDTNVVLRTYAVGEGKTVKPYMLNGIVPPDKQAWDGKWYLDSEKTVEYDFSIPVSEMEDYLAGENDRDLYLWPGQNDVRRVIYITNGDRMPPETVISGDTIDLDTHIPTKSGNHFAGWYADAALTQPISGEQTITEDTYFYGKWEPGYVRFTATLHIENAEDTNFTSSGLLGNWYAMSGSTIFTKTNGTTHTVWCKTEDGREFPVYTSEPTYNAQTGTYSGTQATIPDVYQKYFVYNDLASQGGNGDWEEFIDTDDDNPVVPYSQLRVLPDGSTILHFSYMRIRADVTYQLGSTNRTFTAGRNTYTAGPGELNLTTLESLSDEFHKNGDVYSGVIDCSGQPVEWEYNTTVSNGYRTFTLKNLKHDQPIAEAWPLATWITGNEANFYCWYSTDNAKGSIQTSRIRNMTVDMYKNGADSGRNAVGTTWRSVFQGTNVYAIMYAFECFPYEEDEADFTYDGGVKYKVDPSYSQVLSYGSLTGWGFKAITGCTAHPPTTGGSAATTTNLSNSFGDTTYQALYNKYKSYYGKGPNDTISIGTPYSINGNWTGVFILPYDRDETSLIFDFGWNPNGSSQNATEEYAVFFNQEIAEYQYAMPDFEEHELLTRDGYKFVGWANEFGEVYSEDDWKTMKADAVTDSGSGQVSTYTAKIFFAVWEPIDGHVIEFYETQYAEEPIERHSFLDGGYRNPPNLAVPPDAWVWTNMDTGEFGNYYGDVPLYHDYGVWEYNPLFNDERWVIKVYGQWNNNTLKVAYDANSKEGGIKSRAPSDSNEYTLGVSSVPVAAAMTSADNTEGKTFVGWKLDRNGVIYRPGDHVLAQWMPSMTFVAQWVDAEDLVRLKYNPNGGVPISEYPDAYGFDYARNATANIWDNTKATGEDHFTKEGYRFIGWSTEPGEQPVTYPPGSTIKLTKDLTILYAQWERTDVKLTVKKIVDNPKSGSNPEFHFTATLTEGVFTEPEENAGYEVDGGTATFDLRNQETVVIMVPAGQEVTLKELNTGGYYVSILDNDAALNVSGPEATFLMEDHRTVEVHNLRGSPMPATGGISRLWIDILSDLAIGSALVYIVITVWRRRERRDE